MCLATDFFCRCCMQGQHFLGHTHTHTHSTAYRVHTVHTAYTVVYALYTLYAWPAHTHTAGFLPFSLQQFRSAPYASASAFSPACLPPLSPSSLSLLFPPPTQVFDDASLSLWMVDDIFFCRFGVLKLHPRITRLQFFLVYWLIIRCGSFSCRSESSNKSLVVLDLKVPFEVPQSTFWST